jgi:hypothetical protein
MAKAQEAAKAYGGIGDPPRERGWAVAEAMGNWF